eukprot:CAMPEP_0176496538 /NCGR_PEP_ID=MMETSP0200_2-20121128/11246_1 /TAXON_ID=947934 /ORGANISM="Chaetoceros sp., Strain GSL56" /LENGTH=337 /DNA_ID=CAMNT_0017894495 /DNA_START=225 /DNA_END=1238 /DNA_ORIENTATION=-
MKQDVIVALVVCIGAAILIIVLFLGILLQKRQPDRQRRRNEKTNNGNVNRYDAKDDVEMVPPPIETVVITTTSSSSGIGTTDAFSSFTAADPMNQRPGLEKSISERSGDVWQLRQDDRKEYILENILYKKVTHSKLFGTLYLPHLDDLSSRVRSNSHDVNDANNNNTKSFEPTIQYIQDIENSRSKSNNDKNNNNKKEKKKYTTDTPNCSNDGGGCGATETTPAITMTSGESHQGLSSQEASSSEPHHTYSHFACPICMEPYESGDTVCWSRNEHCPHAFHLECKVDYLLNTDECILCRNNFVLNTAPATADGDDKGLARTMVPATTTTTTTTTNLP